MASFVASTVFGDLPLCGANAAQRLHAGSDEVVVVQLLSDLQGLGVHSLGVVVVATLEGASASVIEGLPVPVIEGDSTYDPKDNDDAKNDEGSNIRPIHPAIGPVMGLAMGLAPSAFWRCFALARSLSCGLS